MSSYFCYTIDKKLRLFDEGKYMNQIKKRLEIIKIAISMTDTETIRLQMLKLEPFEMDDELAEILSLLHNKNYAQAQALITNYIAPKKNTDSKPKKPKKSQKVANSIIDEFELLMPNSNSTTPKNTHHEDTSKQFSPSSLVEEKPLQQDTHATKTTLPYRTILQSEDLDYDINEDMGESRYPKIMPKQTSNIKEKENDLSDTPTIPDGSVTKNQEAQKTKSDITTKEEIAPVDPKESTPEDVTIQKVPSSESIDENFGSTAQSTQNETISIENIKEKSPEEKKDDSNSQNIQEKNKRSAPLVDINSTFDLLLSSFPAKYNSQTRFQSVKIWLRQISIRGYSATEITTMVQHIKELKKNQEYAQAAQLTILAAATGSELGRLMLARELFRGEILEQNKPEAFSIIEQLALRDYPEAICDLGQLYEYGIGTPRDYKMAKKLYEKAFNFGLTRAMKHIEKVTKKTKILPTFTRNS